jgi:hypothetical protein
MRLFSLITFKTVRLMENRNWVWNLLLIFLYNVRKKHISLRHKIIDLHAEKKSKSSPKASVILLDFDENLKMPISCFITPHIL